MVPFLRSDTQARLLAALLLMPEREASLSDLARELQVDTSTLHRELNRLVTSGMLTDRRVGRTRLVRANTAAAFYEPLAQILATAYGPVDAVRVELDNVPGIASALIYGSYAARYRGRPGPPPNDIDVLVIGDPAGRNLRRAASNIESNLDLPVQVIAVTAEQWDRAESGFLQDVQSKPTIPINLRRER